MSACRCPRPRHDGAHEPGRDRVGKYERLHRRGCDRPTWMCAVALGLCPDCRAKDEADRHPGRPANAPGPCATCGAERIPVRLFGVAWWHCPNAVLEDLLPDGHRWHDGPRHAEEGSGC